MKHIKIWTSLLATMLIFSCSSTKISYSWRAENAITKPYHNVMVWGIVPEKDSSIRKQMETHLVNDLISKGYHAISSLEVYQSKAYKKLTENEIVSEFSKTGVDAVITLALLNTEKEERYYPAAVTAQPMNNDNNLDKYYSTVYEKVFTPGYYITTTTYFWESQVFEVAENRLVYTVRTKSFDPFTTDMLAHDNGLRILNDMLKKKVIRNQIPNK